jgi:hypothetical protein
MPLGSGHDGVALAGLGWLHGLDTELGLRVSIMNLACAYTYPHQLAPCHVMPQWVTPRMRGATADSGCISALLRALIVNIIGLRSCTGMQPRIMP